RMVAGLDSRLAHGRGRVSWSYYTSPSECFARAFEQCTAELLEEPCVLVRPRERYRSDPLFFEAVPWGLADFFRGVLSREIGPAFPARAAGACAASVPGDGSRARLPAPLAGPAGLKSRKAAPGR
ncbi:MAG: hypothetical protein HY721_27235, partial [Planctomycetes bacterium]|nr:hypothetical protein [Planctomycetota bacterium]